MMGAYIGKDCADWGRQSSIAAHSNKVHDLGFFETHMTK
jgi:hypothetical protein